MNRQDLIGRLKIFYPKVKWFEPEEKIIRRLSRGYRIVIFIFISVLLSPIIIFIFNEPVLSDGFLKMRMEEFLLVINFYLWIAVFVINLWISYKELKNRIGTDGDLVYFVDYRGTVWSGKPHDIIFNSRYLAGGGILVPLRDKYLKPLYNDKSLEIFLSKGKKAKEYSFELFRYLLKNGYPMISLRLFLFLPAIAFVILGIMYIYQNLIN